MTGELTTFYRDGTVFAVDDVTGALQRPDTSGATLNVVMKAWQASTLSYVKLSVDAAGNLNTAGVGGGGGTQYTDGASNATPIGTVALGKNATNILHALSLDGSGNLNVNLASGTITGGNAAAGLTGAAVPTSAGYTGFSSAGNLVGVSTANPLPVAQQGSVAVTGTFWQGTQPVSIAAMPSTPVTGTFWPATQPVSGTFYQATQPVSWAGQSVTVNTITGFALETGGNLATIASRTPALGSALSAASSPVVIASDNALPAGTNLLGKVGIDQTTPGATNLVSLGTPQFFSSTAAMTAATPIDSTVFDTSNGMRWITYSAYSVTALNVYFMESANNIDFQITDSYQVPAGGGNYSYHCGAGRYVKVRFISATNNPGSVANCLLLACQQQNATETDVSIADKSGNVINSVNIGGTNWFQAAIPSDITIGAVNANATVNVIGAADNNSLTQSVRTDAAGNVRTVDANSANMLELMGAILTELRVQTVQFQQFNLLYPEEPDAIRANVLSATVQ